MPKPIIFRYRIMAKNLQLSPNWIWPKASYRFLISWFQVINCGIIRRRCDPSLVKTTNCKTYMCVFSLVVIEAAVGSQKFATDRF